LIERIMMARIVMARIVMAWIIESPLPPDTVAADTQTADGQNAPKIFRMISPAGFYTRTGNENKDGMTEVVRK